MVYAFLWGLQLGLSVKNDDNRVYNICLYVVINHDIYKLICNWEALVATSKMIETCFTRIPGWYECFAHPFPFFFADVDFR